MSVILKYSDWKSLFEQAQAQAATPLLSQAVTADLIKVALNNQATHSTAGQTMEGGKVKLLASVLTQNPTLPEAIISRYGLKTMLDYWKTCGQLLIANKNPVAIPIVENNCIMFNTDNSFLIKEQDEFSTWINSLNLENWKNKKLSYGVGEGATIFCRIGLDKKVPDAPLFMEHKDPESGKTKYSYIYAGANDKKSLSEFGDSGKMVERLVINQFKLNKNILPREYASATIEVPKLFSYGTKSEIEATTFLTYISGENIKKSKVIEKPISTPPSDIEKKDFSPIKEKFSDLKFPSDSPALEETQRAAIESLINKLKDEVNSKGYSELVLDKIKIISSASNTYGGRVQETHNNSGEPIKKFKFTEDPNTGITDHKAAKTPDGKNNKLAWLRGKNFSDELMTRLKAEPLFKEKNIIFADPEIEWRITDTGGVIDEKRDKSKNPNPGQYVEVSIDGTKTNKSLDTIPGKEYPGKNIDLEYKKCSIISTRLAVAPEVARLNPNAVGADIVNTLFGGKSNTQTVTNWQKSQTK